MRKLTPLIALLCLAINACTTQGGEPPLVAELMQEGAELEAAGNQSEAFSRYERALGLSTTSTTPHVAIARMLRTDKRAGEALDVLKKAQARNAKDVSVLNELGFAYTAQGEYAEALNAFNGAMKLDEDQVESYSGKGVVLDLKGMHSDAQAVYAAAIAKGLESPALQNNLAMSLILTGNTKRAITILEPLVASESVTPSMRQNLALAHGLRGNNARALELGLKDLNTQEARENIALYKRLADAQALKKPTTPAASPKEKTHQAVPVERIDSAKKEAPAATKKPAASTAPAKPTKAVTIKRADAPSEKAPTKTPEKAKEKAPVGEEAEEELGTDASDETVSETPSNASDRGFFGKLLHWEPDAPAKE